MEFCSRDFSRFSRGKPLHLADNLQHVTFFFTQLGRPQTRKFLTNEKLTTNGQQMAKRDDAQKTLKRASRNEMGLLT